MNGFLISFNAVTPLAIYIIIGIGITYFKLVDEETLGKFNSLLFKVFYPVILFSNVYKTDFAAAADFKMIGYNIVFIVVLAGILVFITPKFISQRTTCGSFVQAGYRSNIILFGIPLVSAIFGEENTAMIGIASVFIAPTYNVLAVIILEYFRGENVDAKTLIRNIVKNPLIRGAAVGVCYNLLDLPAPQVLQQSVSNIASAATVFAVIVLGASLNFSSLKQNMKVLISGLLLRLVIVPVISLAIAYFVMGFRGMPLFVTMIISATPVATSAYTMSRTMESDHEICAQYVAISTVLSVFTMFVWILGFMSFHLI